MSVWKCVLVVGLMLGALGCEKKAPPAGEVTIYTSVDEPVATAILRRFEKESGIKVTIVTDTEATKSAALVERLSAERGRPRADVYWGNEPFHTINLAREGAFSPYQPPGARDVPARWRDGEGFWTGVGLRARFIAYSTRPGAKKLTTLADLTDPSLKGKIGICNPGFGTTSGHVAAMYVGWGEPRFAEYMRALRANDCKLLGGNSVVVEQIAGGALLGGLTDSDDVQNAKAAGQAVDGVAVDQDGEGTLLIPTTVALVSGAPHGDAGRKLIDFLTEPAVEREMIERAYTAYSVRGETPVKGMDVDYATVAKQMRTAVELSLTILQDRR